MEDQKHHMHPVKDVYVIDQPQSLSYKPHAKGQRTSTDPSTGKLKFKDSYFKAFKVVLEGVNIRTSTAIKEWILDTK